MPTISTITSGDCISNSQDSNEIKQEPKNGKNHEAFSVLWKQCIEYLKHKLSLKQVLFNISTD